MLHVPSFSAHWSDKSFTLDILDGQDLIVLGIYKL